MIMFIDTKVFTDHRIAKLAAALKMPKDEVLGKLVNVWGMVYVRGSGEISEDDIDHVAGIPGFALKLVSVASLARRVDAGVYLKGAADALVMHKKVTVQHSEKGVKNVESSNARARDRVRPRDPILSTHLDVLDTGEEEVPLRKKKRVRMSSEQRVEVRTIKDAFVHTYSNAYGHAPTWKKHHVANLVSLLRQHNAVEVLARMRFMFSSAPDWLKPPFTLGTLVANFDVFVPVAPSVKSQKYGRVEPYKLTDKRTLREVMEERDAREKAQRR